MRNPISRLPRLPRNRHAYDTTVISLMLIVIQVSLPIVAAIKLFPEPDDFPMADWMILPMESTDFRSGESPS